MLPFFIKPTTNTTTNSTTNTTTNSTKRQYGVLTLFQWFLLFCICLALAFVISMARQQLLQSKSITSLFAIFLMFALAFVIIIQIAIRCFHVTFPDTHVNDVIFMVVCFSWMGACGIKNKAQVRNKNTTKFIMFSHIHIQENTTLQLAYIAECILYCGKTQVEQVDKQSGRVDKAQEEKEIVLETIQETKKRLCHILTSHAFFCFHEDVAVVITDPKSMYRACVIKRLVYADNYRSDFYFNYNRINCNTHKKQQCFGEKREHEENEYMDLFFYRNQTSHKQLSPFCFINLVG